ncbi:hypothetical protein HELRODRAFT_158768 [Helobdella robusta]|uniref:Uncharacterized protein n=1 Tax=Helobdella robusta TaxID=6412 RepID=T1EN87_HELRO|nr:hypothetical protein HELRODRAFT_158768 [Helobdella robusta]ESO12286.1 hypothetical protein HELRODRAFT_158768 [Helobdella robusta]
MNFENRWVLRSALNFSSDREVVREVGREFQRKRPEKAKADLAKECLTRVKKKREEEDDRKPGRLARPSNLTKSKWQTFYENYIHLPDLKNAQESVLKMESKYLSGQKEKNQCWQLFLAAQSRLKDVHANLDPLPTIDARYPQLMNEEVELLKKIRSLSLDFNLYDRNDKNNMGALSNAIEECIGAEKKCERRAFRLFILAVLGSILLAFVITYSFYKLYFTSTLDKLEKNNDSLRTIILEFIGWIELQNNKIKIFLEDMWQTIGFEKKISIDTSAHPSLSDTDDAFVKKSKLFHEVSHLENESSLHEMILIEEKLLKKKEFLKLPTLEISKNEEVSDRGLWATTFGYGSAAVLIPLVFFLFA